MVDYFTDIYIFIIDFERGKNKVVKFGRVDFWVRFIIVLLYFEYNLSEIYYILSEGFYFCIIL